MLESEIESRLHDGLHYTQHANFQEHLPKWRTNASFFYVTLGLGHVRGEPELVLHDGGVTSESPLQLAWTG